MQINPYVAFDGQCAEAFAFYARCLDGRVTMSMPYSAGPTADQTPAEFQDRIMHARVEAAGLVIMGSDAPPGHFKPAQGFHLNVSVAEPTEAERVFSSLAEGGAITMPLAETFWAHRFGMLTDRFGTPWMVNCEKVG